MHIYKNPHSHRNDTLIVLQTHGGEDEALSRNWPGLMEGGCDIMVTSPEDDPSKLFESTLLGQVIRDAPKDYWKLQARAVDILTRALRSHHRTDYRDVMLLHYDCVFVGPINTKGPPGLETRLDPNGEAQFDGAHRATPPWWFDWETLEKFLDAAAQHPVDFQHGYMDHWFPAVCDAHGIPMRQTSLIGYCCTYVSAPDRIFLAEQSIRQGKPLVHGVKTKLELEWVRRVSGKALA